MNRKEQLINVLEHMGFKPKYDDEGDVFIRYQLKFFYFFVNEDDDEAFLSIFLPRFYSFEEGEETLNLAACNKVTYESKMLKVFIDKTFSNVSASCGFFYDNDDVLEMNIQKSVRILGVVQSLYLETLEKLSE